jgi:hypothetical protein
LYVCTYLLAISDNLFSSLQVKITPHDGIAICVFILELSMVMNSTVPPECKMNLQVVCNAYDLSWCLRLMDVKNAFVPPLKTCLGFTEPPGSGILDFLILISLFYHPNGLIGRKYPVRGIFKPLVNPVVGQFF